METSHHRVEGQSVKCGFGLQGVCCRLCSNGPCRITPEAPHGICGASADVIVARNFLRAVAAGSGCYIHVVETTALNLKETALSGGALKDGAKAKIKIKANKGHGKVTYKVSNKKIAKIKKGKLVALKKGKVKLTVTLRATKNYKQKKVTITIKVK